MTPALISSSTHINAQHKSDGFLPFHEETIRYLKTVMKSLSGGLPAVNYGNYNIKTHTQRQAKDKIIITLYG